MNNLKADESGSAVVEFILYALPLFLPLAIFVTSFHAQDSINFAAQTLARNVLRIYQTGDSISHVEESVNTLIDTADKTTLSNLSLQRIPDIKVSCQKYPCLTPSNLINVKVDLYLSNRIKPIEVEVNGYVDAWNGN